MSAEICKKFLEALRKLSLRDYIVTQAVIETGVPLRVMLDLRVKDVVCLPVTLYDEALQYLGDRDIDPDRYLFVTGTMKRLNPNHFVNTFTRLSKQLKLPVRISFPYLRANHSPRLYLNIFDKDGNPRPCSCGENKFCAILKAKWTIRCDQCGGALEAP